MSAECACCGRSFILWTWQGTFIRQDPPQESGGLEHPLLQPHTTQTLAMQQQYHDVPATAIPSMHRRQLHSKQRFVTELSQRLFEFVIQLLPTQEEMAVKEDVRKLLERLIRTIEPDSRLLSFGSTANGFSLRNSGERFYLLDTEDDHNYWSLS